MSLKREEIAIEDEPPGLEAVGTATLHLQDGLQPRLQRGGILRSGGNNVREIATPVCGDSRATTKRTRARTKRRKELVHSTRRRQRSRVQGSTTSYVVV